MHVTETREQLIDFGNNGKRASLLLTLLSRLAVHGTRSLQRLSRDDCPSRASLDMPSSTQVLSRAFLLVHH